MKWILSIFLLTTISLHAQWKSYRIAANGDTINKIDNNNLRQGRWVNKVESLRGEPGYEEEGMYKDGKKEGIWRAYTVMGDLFAVERYKWGYKDGKSQYYSIQGIEREESWKAVNPASPFDTVEVFDPVDPYKVKLQVVKIEGTSVKHGTWKYYDVATGGVIKSEKWFLDKLEVPKPETAANEGAVADNLADGKNAKTPAKVKPKEVLDFEKKTGRKKVKVIDGSTY